MEQNNSKYPDFLTSFKRAKDQMIATNETSYNGEWGNRRYRQPLKDYTQEEIEKIIDSGSLPEQQKLSRTYFYKDGFYKRIIIHYATLLKYMGILIPNPSFGKNLSTPHIKKRYYSAMDFIEKASLQVLLTNFAQRALVDGSYFGVIQSINKNVLSVLDLPSAYCCSRFKDTLGNDIIEFDVSYFNTILDLNDRKAALKTYPKVISKAYNDWKDGKKRSKWVFIPSDIGICFQFFDGRPIFLNVIPATIQYDEAIEIERERDLDEIRKIIVQKIPHLNDGRLVFEPDEAQEMHDGAVGMLKGNKNISVLTTYADVEAIISKTAADSASNNLEKMMQNIYYESGTSSQIFSSTGSSTLETSLKNDLALMMYLANKFSHFITNIVNSLFANSNIYFKYEILPISYYNEDKYVDNSFKLAGSGYSFILPALAMGITQKDLGNIKDLENDVLKLQEKLIPLSSSYTQSSSESNNLVGAPKKEEENKSEKTIQNEESLDNQTEGGSE